FFCSCIACSFFMSAVWVYGEKDRFTKLSVTEIQGTVLDVRRFGNRHFSSYIVQYSYIDKNGITHYAQEGVDSGKTWVTLRKNAQLPILYLNDDSSISRIVEQKDIKRDMAKFFLC